MRNPLLHNLDSRFRGNDRPQIQMLWGTTDEELFWIWLISILTLFRISILGFRISVSQPAHPAQLATHSWVNYAKQTQFSKRQNHRNTLSHTDLQQYPAPLHPQKTNPIKPNSPPPAAPGKNPESQSETHVPICRGGIKDRESSVENQESSIEYQKSSIIAQNKANVKMGNIDISTATIKAYGNEQWTTNIIQNKPNQTQFSRPRPNPRSSFLSRYRTLRAEFAHKLPQLSTDTFDLLHALSY